MMGRSLENADADAYAAALAPNQSQATAPVKGGASRRAQRANP
jgi:hypothetical protein